MSPNPINRRWDIACGIFIQWSATHTTMTEYTLPESIHAKFKKKQSKNMSQIMVVSGGHMDWDGGRGNFLGCRNTLYLDWGGGYIHAYKCKWLSSCPFKMNEFYVLYCIYIMLRLKKMKRCRFLCPSEVITTIIIYWIPYMCQVLYTDYFTSSTQTHLSARYYSHFTHEETEA